MYVDRDLAFSFTLSRLRRAKEGASTDIQYARALVNDYHPNEIEEKKYIKKEKKGQNRANT